MPSPRPSRSASSDSTGARHANKRFCNLHCTGIDPLSFNQSHIPECNCRAHLLSLLLGRTAHQAPQPHPGAQHVYDRRTGFLKHRNYQMILPRLARPCNQISVIGENDHELAFPPFQRIRSFELNRHFTILFNDLDDLVDDCLHFSNVCHRGGGRKLAGNSESNKRKYESI